MMNTLAKRFGNRLLRPCVELYLRKERTCRYQDLKLTVSPGVFHPGLFHSTRRLLEFVASLDLAGKRVLELGAGAGLLALYCARRGALVTASDISQAAIQNLRDNARANHLELTVIASDLFRAIPVQPFDFILCNPPFYKRQSQSEAERAWYCGENGEYFQDFFQQLGAFWHPALQVLMVLSSECDLDLIVRLARQHHFDLQKLLRKRLWLETIYIFRINAAPE